MRRVIALTALVTMIIPAFASSAGANTGCGTYSFGFLGTRLLNDGISDVAGPFPIELPAGTYTVTLVAHDHHDTQVGVPTQPGEQYVVELDSGYRSPPSIDIPDELILTTTVFENQVVDASTAITVRHFGTPGINSVDPVCVGFTPEPPGPGDATPPTEPPGPGDATPPGEPTTPGVVAPDPDGPERPDPVSPNEPPTDQPIETPTQDIGDPVGIVREPDSPTTPGVTPEVQGVIEPPPVAPQLAITGPREHAITLSIVALTLVALGASLVLRGRTR